jgi:type II secretory pathway component PulJ
MIMMARRTARRGGWTLLDMVLAIALLSAFVALASQAMVQVTSRNRDSIEAAGALDRWQGIERQLRDDAWDATAFALEPDGALRISTDEGDVIWRQLPEQQRLQREQGGRVRFFLLSTPMAFDPQPSALLVYAGSDGRSADEHRLVMISQKQWLKGRP